jgi:hypothetical protein
VCRSATVNWSSSRAAPGDRITVPLLGVVSRFGRSCVSSLNRSCSPVPGHAAHHARCAGAGCPSFGGQRTVWFASKRHSSHLCSTAISSSRPSPKTNSQQPARYTSVAPLSVRLCAAPGRLGRAGTGFARATTAGAFGQRRRAAVVVRDRVRPSNGASNWSVKRTHNGGPRLLAPSWSAAPLCAA